MTVPELYRSMIARLAEALNAPVTLPSSQASPRQGNGGGISLVPVENQRDCRWLRG
jgi:hypothetical protein